MISQLTVFIENKQGHLASACRSIADAGINMRALFLADTAEFGIARIFCDRPNFTAQALREAGFRAKITPVLAIKIPNRQAALADLLDLLAAQKVNTEYCYCFSVSPDHAINVLKVDDSSAESILKTAGYQIVTPQDVYTPD